MTIRAEVEDGVAVIAFDRPDVLNAFNEAMGAAVLRSVEEAAADDGVRCIVLTGTGRAFSSGEDLGALAEGYERGEASPLGDTLVTRYNPLIRAITGAPKPVIAAVNGVAAGAGASVAFACDFCIAVEGAKFILAFVKVGLVPDSGALWFLSRAIGTARTWRLAASGDPLTAEQALELGLVDALVAPDRLEEEWRALARRLAQGPTLAYGLTKALLHGAAGRSLPAQLEAEVQAQTAAGNSADHLEGMRAFFAKRSPTFGGR